jgi:uncharacterized membrane protein
MPHVSLIEIHMAAAHFPIGLLLSSAWFDITGLALRRPSLRETGFRVHLLGIIAAAVTVVLGLLGNPFQGAAGETGAIVFQHQAVGIAGLVIFGALAAWRARRRNAMRGLGLALYTAATCLGVGVVGLTGYLGSQLRG